MKNIITFSLLLCLFAVTVHAQRPEPDTIQTEQGEMVIQPIRHGTFTISWQGLTIYVDPNGGAEAFAGLVKPDLILITDIHGDHLNMDTIESLDTEGTRIVVPQAVADRMPSDYRGQLVILNNGDETDRIGFTIRAVPMYNLPESEDSRHPKGRGNGYLLTMGGKRVYISGDTEGIPEMRSLENIDVAFVCMNLPYTMGVEQAADAVLDFKPAIVYPYHYRGQDTQKFKQLVTAEDEGIEVRLREWY